MNVQKLFPVKFITILMYQHVVVIIIIPLLLPVGNTAASPAKVNLTLVRNNKRHNVIEDAPHLSNRVIEKLLADYKAGRDIEDINLNITELIKKYGYDVEAHNVLTPDGYNLTMFRIPGKGPPVFLMHGLLCSSDDYITAGPESGLGYLFAAAGYDVWLGNARGNKHSRMHVRYSPDTEVEQFWNFSWDEIGRFDLPTMIDYVLNTTRRKQLVYAGHSQGTTSFFVMTSMRPEYNQKIALMIALSPIAWMSHMYNPFIQMGTVMIDTFAAVIDNVGMYEFVPDKELIRKMKKALCTKNELADLYCNNIIFLLCGFDYAQINASNLHVILSHMPSGSSAKQLIHYGQEVQSGKFQRYNHGEEKNMKIYGQRLPPNYPVEAITCPIALFYADGDWLASLTDIAILRSKLKNVVDDYLIPFPGFNHMDFLIGKGIKKLIFARIMRNLKVINYLP